MSLRRRRLLALSGLWPVLGPSRVQAADPTPTGWVLPALPPPPCRVTPMLGAKQPLAGIVAGKRSAVQLMFTGCSTSCPIQGALFAALARRLRSPDVQLLSISIDVLGDTPASLAAWQGRLGPHPSWHAAVADAADVDRLAAFLKGAPARSGTHTAQVFIFDRHGRLRYRTSDNPGIGELEALLLRVGES